MKILVLILTLLSFNAMSEIIKLNDSNTVSLKNAVMEDSASEVINELAKREGNSEPVIYLILDTPGGSVFAGLNLIHFLKGYSKPVKTITIFAASMGFQIVEGNPGERLILDTGVLMSHPMSGGFRGELGTGFSLDNQHGYIKEIIETMDKQVVSRTKGKVSLEEYQKSYDNELWTTGQKAIDKGYADTLVQATCSEELSSSTNFIEVREFIGFTMMGPMALQIKYEFSKCPLQMAILRYQVALVLVATEEKIIMHNSGYDIPIKQNDSKTENYLPSKAETSEIQTFMQNSSKYRTFMFFLKRDMNSVREIKWM
jgi:ATP-dependent protease ClpP protease subunit